VEVVTSHTMHERTNQPISGCLNKSSTTQHNVMSSCTEHHCHSLKMPDTRHWKP